MFRQAPIWCFPQGVDENQHKMMNDNRVILYIGGIDVHQGLHAENLPSLRLHTISHSNTSRSPPTPCPLYKRTPVFAQ